MGWGNGTSVVQDLWDKIEDYIPPICREEVAQAFIEVFEDYDCDNMEETDIYAIANGNDPLFEDEEDFCLGDCDSCDTDCEGYGDITPAFIMDTCPQCGDSELQDEEAGVVSCVACGKVFAIDDAEPLPVVIQCPDCQGEDTELVDVCECGAFQFRCNDCGNVWEEEDLEIEVIEEENK